MTIPSNIPGAPAAVMPRPRPYLLLLPAGFFISILLVCSLAILRMSVGVRNAEWSGWSLEA